MKWKNACLLLIFIPVLSGCAVIKIQQNLPGSLWGNWSVERIGFEVNTNIKDYPYQRACFNKDDIIHFSSDKKITFKWNDAQCVFRYYFVGRYQVTDRTLSIAHENPPQRRNLPFYMFDEYRIQEINETTLELRRFDIGSQDDLPRLIVLRKIRD